MQLRYIQGKFKRIVKWSPLFAIVLLVTWIFIGIIQWANCNCSKSDINYGFGEDEEAMIAILKTDNNLLPDLKIARLKSEVLYKYPFFSPQSFSDFYILDFQHLDSLYYVFENNDTISSCGWWTIDKVPSELKVLNFQKRQIATYYPDTIFSENIKTKASISIFKQIVFFGPTGWKCKNECP